MYLKFFKLIFTFVNFIKNAIMFDNMNTVYDVKIQSVVDISILKSNFFKFNLTSFKTKYISLINFILFFDKFLNFFRIILFFIYFFLFLVKSIFAINIDFNTYIFK